MSTRENQSKGTFLVHQFSDTVYDIIVWFKKCFTRRQANWIPACDVSLFSLGVFSVNFTAVHK